MICNYCISLLPWFLSSAGAGTSSAPDVFCNTENRLGSSLPRCLYPYPGKSAAGSPCVPWTEIQYPHIMASP